MTADAKLVYSFGNGDADGRSSLRELLGGKGANLAEMSRLGIPVPSGFTISARVCHQFSRSLERGEKGGRYPKGTWQQVEAALARLEEESGRRFGDHERPLLVSVRSGAAVSMPGMMDTILNLGLNPETVNGLARQTDNPRFAWDSYRRFIQMYGNVVLRIPAVEFETLLEASKEAQKVRIDSELSVDALKALVREQLALVRDKTGTKFPAQPMHQLRGAIDAVLMSWNNERARVYRRIHRIQDLLGTAVNVQAMVFGNMGEDSGTGVCFTRDPATGEKKPFGEFLVDAQGEDVVAGIRTPEPLSDMAAHLGETAHELSEVMAKLERHFRDMQDIEFTVERGTLYILQTRSGKRTARSALRTSVSMVEEDLIDTDTALLRIDAGQLEQILHPSFAADAEKTKLATGLAASPGCVSGAVALTPERAEEWADAGKEVLLLRIETSPEDLKGMVKSRGFLTARGGKTSHAAVVARQMGKACVAGCTALTIDEAGASFELGGKTFGEGDVLSIDGSLGEVYEGAVPTVEAEMPDDFRQIMEWADERRRLKVRANAETPRDCQKAREFGAEGIGLCRTEHMFFAEDRIDIVREMILATNDDQRREALARLLPMQRKDFVEIFEIMEGLPVNIRLLDPPLHEFLPHEHDQQRAVSEALGTTTEHVRRRVEELFESNPMLGHRGCRLGITFPEIYEMQMIAILEAGLEVSKAGRVVLPEIMIPLPSTVRELGFLRTRLLQVAEEVFNAAGAKVAFQIGTMVETPRAALTGAHLAEEAEFFSFGTNDLTQMTFGFSRDDAGSFLPYYIDTNVLPIDPFVTIDRPGVGRLMKLATDEGRHARADLKVGICGESGGDPQSIEFCESLSMDYVSCSPFRLPTARLAAAQASISASRGR